MPLDFRALVNRFRCVRMENIWFCFYVFQLPLLPRLPFHFDFLSTVALFFVFRTAQICENCLFRKTNTQWPSFPRKDFFQYADVRRHVSSSFPMPLWIRMRSIWLTCCWFKSDFFILYTFEYSPARLVPSFQKCMYTIRKISVLIFL